MLDIAAAIGYSASAFTYLAHGIQERENMYVLIGMMLVTLGYSSLFGSKIIALYKNWKQRLNKKNDEVTHDDDAADYQWKTIMQYFGYALLATFFTVILIRPEFTIHVRFYDIFAAIGYVMLLLSKWISTKIALVPIILYYLFGSIKKITDKGWINKTQLVARTILLIYYGATWISTLQRF